MSVHMQLWRTRLGQCQITLVALEPFCYNFTVRDDCNYIWDGTDNTFHNALRTALQAALSYESFVRGSES